MWKLWRVGKVFGVELKLHGTFVLMLAFFALSGGLKGGPTAALLSLALGLLVFGVVVLHELGHIAAARFFGFPPHDIVLTPLGGIARFGAGGRNGSLPTKPFQEIVVAAAGPAVNLLLAGSAYLALKLAPWAALGANGALAASLTEFFFTTNLVLMAFNLIPALPMDGGRILRAALTPKMGYLQATRMAAKVARWTTLLMAIYAVSTGNFSILFIAGMVFVMSYAELAQAHITSARGNPLFQAFQAFGGGQRGRGASTSPGGPVVIDQYGNPVGGTPGGRHSRGGWSSAEHVQPSADGSGWTVKTVRLLDD